MSMTGLTMDQEGAIRVMDLVEHPLPSGWSRCDELNVFRHIHSKLSLIVTACREADGHLWVHLSVAGRDRLPTWPELVAVRDWIVGAEAKAIQVVPPRSEYVNLHPFCLHLWVCLDGDPLPDFRKDGVV
jgi:hypothetical protein